MNLFVPGVRPGNVTVFFQPSLACVAYAKQTSEVYGTSYKPTLGEIYLQKDIESLDRMRSERDDKLLWAKIPTLGSTYSSSTTQSGFWLLRWRYMILLSLFSTKISIGNRGSMDLSL
jgi:hypothetical protein